MKRHSYIFFLAMTVAALVGTAWWWVLEHPMDFLDPEYGVWLAKLQMADAPQPGGTVAIIGDSCTVADVVPPLIGENVIDLGLGGASPIEGYFMAKRLLNRNHPRAVVLSYTPMHLAKIDRFGSRTNLFDRAAKFGLLDLRDLEEIRQTSRELKDDSIFGPPAPLDIDASSLSDLVGSG